MTHVGQPVKIWGIIPAAGMSRRMVRPKQLLPFGDSTMIGTVTRTLLEADLVGVVVVTRTELVEESDLPNDPRIIVAINDDPNSEMIDSIRIGLATLAGEGAGLDPPRDADGVLVLPADMPTLTVDHCRVCVSAFRHDPSRIVIAACEGKRGHPILFPFSLRTSVDRLEGGLRSLVELHPEKVHLVEIGDPGVTRDIDTPDDYDRLSD
jgi:molybdenum cofactor cytidylyltransferase